MATEYRRFWIDCAAAVEREWLLAEAFELGAEGAEETEAGAEGAAGSRFRACIYAPPDRVEGVRAGLSDVAPASTVIGEAESPPSVDWSEAWKEGLEALSISDRLLVRPPFVEAKLVPGQREIVIDPGQAFGTGAHASTRLCLEWLDDLIGGKAGEALGGAAHFDRMLDVGTGSGVLALAAVALGVREAVGFDLDPVATEAAEEAARVNDVDGLAERVHFFTGPIEALGEGPSASRPAYPLVVANLLKREMLPISGQIAGWTAAEGRILLAGLLEEDVAEVLDAFGRASFVEAGRREAEDAVGRWVGLCLARQSSV